MPPCCHEIKRYIIIDYLTPLVRWNCKIPKENYSGRKRIWLKLSNNTIILHENVRDVILNNFLEIKKPLIVRGTPRNLCLIRDMDRICIEISTRLCLT